MTEIIEQKADYVRKFDSQVRIDIYADKVIIVYCRWLSRFFNGKTLMGQLKE